MKLLKIFISIDHPSIYYIQNKLDYLNDEELIDYVKTNNQNIQKNADKDRHYRPYLKNIKYD